jgi:hypothetical protein
MGCIYSSRLTNTGFIIIGRGKVAQHPFSGGLGVPYNEERHGSTQG